MSQIYKLAVAPETESTRKFIPQLEYKYRYVPEESTTQAGSITSKTNKYSHNVSNQLLLSLVLWLHNFVTNFIFSNTIPYYQYPAQIYSSQGKQYRNLAPKKGFSSMVVSKLRPDNKMLLIRPSQLGPVGSDHEKQPERSSSPPDEYQIVNLQLPSHIDTRRILNHEVILVQFRKRSHIDV